MSLWHELAQRLSLPLILLGTMFGTSMPGLLMLLGIQVGHWVRLALRLRRSHT